MVARLLKIAFFFAPRYLGERKSRRDEFEDILKGKFCVSDDRLPIDRKLLSSKLCRLKVSPIFNRI